eukprot:3565480-Pleurochrysis_carterae.AAC.1
MPAHIAGLDFVAATTARSADSAINRAVLATTELADGVTNETLLAASAGTCTLGDGMGRERAFMARQEGVAVEGFKHSGASPGAKRALDADMGAASGAGSEAEAVLDVAPDESVRAKASSTVAPAPPTAVKSKSESPTLVTPACIRQVATNGTAFSTSC